MRLAAHGEGRWLSVGPRGVKGFTVLPHARVVTIGALVLAALAILASLALLDRQVEYQFSEQQAYVAGDMVDRLVLLQQDAGDAGLLRAVQRETETASPGQVFLLVDARGVKLAGNLPGWPRGVDADGDWESFNLPDAAAARAITATLPGGAKLLVGESDASRLSVRRTLAVAAAAALAVLTLVILVPAALWGRLVARRLSGLAKAAQSIAAGDRSMRLPLSREGDGFDDLSRALNHMVEENARLLSGLEAVTHSLAHDLRTPLMRMHAAISDARAATAPEQQADALSRAEIEAGRTVAVFSGLSDLALAESGLSREAMQEIDLHTLARDVVELVEPLAEEREQTLGVALEPITLRGHRQLLLQALVNLMTNAIRHAPPHSEIEIGLQRTGGGAEIVVRDTGPGLTPAQMLEAVRPFVRLQAGVGGLGLGLAIVSAVARLHEGALRLEAAQPGLRARLQLWTERNDGQLKVPAR